MAPILSPVKRSRIYSVIYMIVFLVKYAPFYLLMLPRIPVWGAILAFAISGTTILLFIVVSMKDPGYIKPKGKTLLDLYEKYEGDFVCPY
jgi:NADH:ubiquinone oxidoreductase subunit 6 (subunit J)